MGRTGPVVRAGLVARARRGGAMVTAVTATAAMFLAGCGTRTADLPARGGPAPAAAASTGPAGDCLRAHVPRRRRLLTGCSPA